MWYHIHSYEIKFAVDKIKLYFKEQTLPSGNGIHTEYPNRQPHPQPKKQFL